MLKEINATKDVEAAARVRRIRLRKQLNFLEGRASRAIKNELSSIKEAEVLEAAETSAEVIPNPTLLPPGPDVLVMSPFD